MKRRFWAGLLSFVMLWSLLPANALAAEKGAPEPDTGGLSFVKTVTPEGADGTYKITMEAYAKGKTVSVSKTEPCDIVLVLDVSGSMDDEFSNNALKGYTEIRYKTKINQTRPATNQELLDEYTRNKEVYYKDADNNYQKVTVACAADEPTYESAGSFTYRDVQNNSGKYFAQKGGETEYLSVKIQDVGWPDYKLYIGDKSFEIPKKGALGIRVNWGAAVSVDGYTFYTQEPGKVTYTYTDTTTNAVIETSVGDKNPPTNHYYKPYYGSKSKIETLQEAANAFIDSVLAKTPENAKHRIAIVKFAGNSTDEIGNDMYNDYYSWWNYYTYNYSQVVKGLTEVNNTSAGELKAAVDELQPTGATRADYGMQHAAELMPQSVSGRKQIVVMFTDGEPTSANKFEDSVANGAIAAAKDLKERGVTVHTIGMFKDADPANTNDNFNKYMHYVSSNYPSAESMSNDGGNGGNNGYYKKATGAADLSEIFSQITSEVGSTTVTLDSNAVMVDTVSDHFDAPDASAVKAWSVPCTAIDEQGNPTWNEAAKTAIDSSNIKVEGRKVSVTGFDYSTTYVTKANEKAAKLVVEFTVKPSAGTFRGWVPTNKGSKADIFENAQATIPAASTPTVPNVDIQPVGAKVTGGAIEAAPKAEVDLFGTNGFRDYTTADGTNNAGVKITYKLVQVQDDKGTPMEGAEPTVITVEAGKTLASALAKKVNAPDTDGESNYYKLTVTVTSKNPNTVTTPATAAAIVTVAAKATEPTKYELKYVWNGGKAAANADYTHDGQYAADADIDVPTKDEAVREGYTFAGWYTDEGLNQKWTMGDKMPASNLTLYANWEQNPPEPTYTVTYIDGVNGSAFKAQVHSGLKSGVATPAFNGTPERDGYTFRGWDPAVEATVTKNVTYTATWTRNSSRDDDDDYYFAIQKVDAQDGHALNGATFELYQLDKNDKVVNRRVTKTRQHSSENGIALFSVDNKNSYDGIWYYAEVTAPEGYVLDSAEHKIKAKDFSDSLSTAVKNADTVQNYRGSTPDLLNDADHFAYVIGYKDGNVRPYGLISRAETTTIFFRLLKNSVRDGNLLTSNTYTDVADDYWANTAISTMTGLGIVQGRSTTTFDPQAPITRAQFAAICARFDTGKSSGTQSFTDIKGHWAEKYIERAAELGWIKGFEDGTFRPDTYITRAQAMTMINRVLNRIPEENGDLLSSMNVWPDCNPGDWFYLAVQEATNSHDYKHKAGNYEKWTSMNKDPNWTRYEN